MKSRVDKKRVHLENCIAEYDRIMENPNTPDGEFWKASDARYPLQKKLNKINRKEKISVGNCIDPRKDLVG
ncbi:MAG: hypothetical protein FWD32_00230 [Firmicutes bacterium]|nr:hypothetical protein [Bacillota bacterium]